MKNNGLVVSIVSFALLGLATMASAGPASQPGSVDWPQWRGPNHDGVAPSSPKLLDSWPKNGPTLLWKSDYLPSGDGGWASCTVADGKVYVYYTGHVAKDGSPSLRPITADLLADWGWREDVPADLVTKLEAERVSPAFKKVQARNKKAEMEDYAKTFAAGLDPKVAEKYADVITKRLNNLEVHGAQGESGWSWGGNWSWDLLTTIAKYKDKEFKSCRDVTIFFGKFGYQNQFYQALAAFGDATVRVMKYTDTIVCLDAETGKELWRKSFDGTYPLTGYAGGFGGAGTPAAANGKVYVSGLFGVYCLSTSDGAVVWQKPLKSYTYTSPLVVDGKVICCVEGPLAALDAETGKLLWRQPKCWGNSSPVLWTHDGKTHIIFGEGNACQTGGTCCIDPANGNVMWSCLAENSGCTPVVSGDDLVLKGNQKMRVYKMTPEKAELVWEKPRAGGGYLGSAVVYQGCIYDSLYGGGGHCLDLKTGEIQWTAKEGFGLCYSSPCVVDGKVIAYPQRLFDDFGSIVMFRPTPEKFEMLGKFKPKFEPIMAAGDLGHILDLSYITSPTVANGRLYVRMADYVGCYDLRAGK